MCMVGLPAGSGEEVIWSVGRGHSHSGGFQKLESKAPLYPPPPPSCTYSGRSGGAMDAVDRKKLQSADSLSLTNLFPENKRAVFFFSLCAAKTMFIVSTIAGS